MILSMRGEWQISERVGGREIEIEMSFAEMMTDRTSK